MTTEEEDFEFRKRLEEEQAALPPPDLQKEEQSFMSKVGQFAPAQSSNRFFC